MRDKALEVMARAEAAFEEVSYDKHRGLFNEQAAHVLAALQAEGMAVVPVEPSEEMLAAGDSAIPRAELDEHGMRMMGREVALECWSAMLAAASQEKDA